MLAVIEPPVVLPGPPEINDGRPIERVVSGTSVELVCKSFGTSRDTQVLWYKVVNRNSQPVDRTYNVQVMWYIIAYDIYTNILINILVKYTHLHFRFCKTRLVQNSAMYTNAMRRYH